VVKLKIRFNSASLASGAAASGRITAITQSREGQKRECGSIFHGTILSDSDAHRGRARCSIF